MDTLPVLTFRPPLPTSGRLCSVLSCVRKCRHLHPGSISALFLSRPWVGLFQRPASRQSYLHISPSALLFLSYVSTHSIISLARCDQRPRVLRRHREPHCELARHVQRHHPAVPLGAFLILMAHQRLDHLLWHAVLYQVQSQTNSWTFSCWWSRSAAAIAPLIHLLTVSALSTEQMRSPF